MTPKQKLDAKIEAFHTEGFFLAVCDVLRYFDECNMKNKENLLEPWEYQPYAEDVRKMLLKDLENYKSKLKF